MKVLAVTCYTGDEKLCTMTDFMLQGLWESGVVAKIDLQIAAVGQGAERPAECRHPFMHPENVGFAFGMNLAIENSLRAMCESPDYVLCLNNDLEFPEKNWLAELMKCARADRICVPATDRTSLRIQAGPIASPSIPVQEMGAYCWLIPFAWCKWLKETHGFWLFSEEFAPAYGEDNLTAFLLSKKYGANCFRWVRRSWVKHLRAKTAAAMKIDRKKSSALLVKKLREQLTDPKLRGDLRKWANSTIAILTRRL